MIYIAAFVVYAIIIGAVLAMFGLNDEAQHG